MSGRGFLSHAKAWMADFLGTKIKEVVFIPYAAVTDSFDDYVSMAQPLFRELGYSVRSLHHCQDLAGVLEQAEAIVVGGGNTFHLLRRLYDEGLLPLIRSRVSAGVPYVGWSAGANLACPTIMTTNDMPVVWLPSLDALAIVSFQINPHYIGTNPPGFYGETRARRILEFSHLHPHTYVVGLPEGGAIRIEGNRIDLLGCSKVNIFLADNEPIEASSLDFLEKPAQLLQSASGSGS